MSTSASLSRPAPPITLIRARAPREVAAFTLSQRIARYGLTVLAIAAMSALFATQIAATLR